MWRLSPPDLTCLGAAGSREHPQLSSGVKATMVTKAQRRGENSGRGGGSCTGSRGWRALGRASASLQWLGGCYTSSVASWSCASCSDRLVYSLPRNSAWDVAGLQETPPLALGAPSALCRKCAAACSPWRTPGRGCLACGHLPWANSTAAPGPLPLFQQWGVFVHVSRALSGRSFWEVSADAPCDAGDGWLGRRAGRWRAEAASAVLWVGRLRSSGSSLVLEEGSGALPPRPCGPPPCSGQPLLCSGGWEAVSAPRSLCVLCD